MVGYIWHAGPDGSTKSTDEKLKKRAGNRGIPSGVNMFVNRIIGIGLLTLLLTGCASKGVLLELQGSIIYEKPQITAISHSVADNRATGGTVVVSVKVVGDPGLDGSFDISPEIVVDQPLSESADGSYSGQFAFPIETTGGPFTIIGKLRHAEAGEVTLRDRDPVSISLVR